MGELRSKEGQKAYDDYKASGALSAECVLCTKIPLRSFTHWVILENIFPYDKIAALHHMIVPKRHIIEPEFSKEELDELLQIKESYIHKNYDFVLEATYRKKSIPAHMHYHLVVVKD